MAKDLDSSLKWVHQAEGIASKYRKTGAEGYFHTTARDDFDIVKAYFVASLTFYGKCFTESKGRHAQMARSWLDAKYRDLHDDFMRYRHNFAAHSGDARFEAAKTYVLVNPDKRDLLPYLPTARAQPDLVLPGQGELGFSDLIEHARDKVAERYNKVSQKIIHELIVPAGVHYWTAAAAKGEPVELAAPPKSEP